MTDSVAEYFLVLRDDAGYCKAIGREHADRYASRSAEELVAAWNSIPERYQRVLTLVFGLDGRGCRSRAETAELLEMSGSGSVSNRKREAIGALNDAVIYGPHVWWGLDPRPRNILLGAGIRQLEDLTPQSVRVLFRHRQWRVDYTRTLNTLLAARKLPDLRSLGSSARADARKL